MTGLASVVVGLALAGCGSSRSTASTASTLSGVAASQAPLGGARLTVKDSSATQQQKNAVTSNDGTFTLDVTGLQPPFMLEADWSDDAGEHALRSVAETAGTTRIDPLTDIAMAAATAAGADGGTSADDRAGHERIAAGFSSFLQQLRMALAPLFDLYGIGSDLMQAYPTAMKALLKDVSFSAEGGTLVATNRATGAVIFSGPVSNLAAGAFHQENLPAGPGTSTPTQLDGAALYSANCSGCHGPLATSSKMGVTAAMIQGAVAANTGGMGSLSSLTSAEVQAIADALAGSATTPPAACTYTYGAWGSCQSDGTQTRTVATSSPSGCTGTPVLTQTCTTAPVTCTSFTYSAWGACSASGTQTRTVASSAPAGCTGGAPVLSQSCTPPVANPVTTANVVASCTGCHGLTSNTTVFKAGGYTVTGRSSAQWLTTVNNMVGMGASLAPGTTAQNYADFLANAP
jgi:mono/diheme cytochrome c family protein